MAKKGSLDFFLGLAVLLAVISLISYFLHIDFFKILLYAFAAYFFLIFGLFAAIIIFFIFLLKKF